MTARQKEDAQVEIGQRITMLQGLTSKLSKRGHKTETSQKIGETELPVGPEGDNGFLTEFVQRITGGARVTSQPENKIENSSLNRMCETSGTEILKPWSDNKILIEDFNSANQRDKSLSLLHGDENYGDYVEGQELGTEINGDEIMTRPWSAVGIMGGQNLSMATRMASPRGELGSPAMG